MTPAARRIDRNAMAALGARRAFCASVALSLLTARSQAQPARPVIGFLHTTSAEASARTVAAFRRGLADSGYVDGDNVTIESRWAQGRFERLPELAAELVQRRVDVIPTPGNTVAALAAQAATKSIPIVFGVSDDPVKFGLVASLARPAGNATGMNHLTSELVPKRMGLLRELVPHANQLAVLLNPSNATNAEATTRHAAASARLLGLRISHVEARTGEEIEAAFVQMRTLRCDALFVGPDAYFHGRREQLARLAQSQAIPASYAVRDDAEAGGLMSYGPDVADKFRVVGSYAARVLKGERPARMPVVQPTRFELVINLKAARAIGLSVPQSLLLGADEVIE